MLSIYHAKFYLKIRTGSQVILTLFLGFGSPPVMIDCIIGMHYQSLHVLVGISGLQ